ncbi:alpha/beta hydrolase [Pseudoalteromonas arctica]|uniref:alpha/beta hydrolase n=1 Tax=Pseudoalteromonas arctica TaxID=394751 RepID=UPI0024945EF4|nr:alpha/beta hydrolase-fold protein [Pseudoalteromonas arctica]
MAIHRLEISNSSYTADNFVTLTAYSSHLKGRGDISIYQEATSNKNVPMIVLLHGVYGSHWVWSQLGGVHKVYQQLRSSCLNEFVLVMPSDGAHAEGSGYLPLKNADYEAWIVDDVISAVIQTQPMCSSSSNIYITGLSMGGYGALCLGAKHPTIFSGISAHSSITELDDFNHFVDEHTLKPLKKTTDKYKGDVFKTLSANKKTLPPLRFDCGKDDVLFSANTALAKKLVDENVPHTFDIFAGTHCWEYWHEHVAKTMIFFAQLESKTHTQLK